MCALCTMLNQSEKKRFIIHISAATGIHVPCNTSKLMTFNLRSIRNSDNACQSHHKLTFDKCSVKVILHAVAKCYDQRRKIYSIIAQSHQF